RARVHPDANERTNPVNAAKNPRNRYSLVMMLSTCFCDAPNVFKSTLSRVRCTLLTTTALTNTMRPVTMLNDAMNRTTKEMRLNMASKVLRTRPRSIAEIDGYACTTASCIEADSSADAV